MLSSPLVRLIGDEKSSAPCAGAKLSFAVPPCFSAENDAPLPALYRERPAGFHGARCARITCVLLRTREAGAIRCPSRALQPGARSLGRTWESPSPSMYGSYYTHLRPIAQDHLDGDFRLLRSFWGCMRKGPNRGRGSGRGRGGDYSSTAFSATGSVISSPELTLTVRTRVMPVPSSVRVRVSWSTKAICG